MKKNKYLNNALIVLSFCVMAFISDMILMHTHVLFSTDDMQFHLKRVMEIFENNYSPLFSFNYFHGSAVMSMYPYFSLFPLVFLLHITSSYLNAYFYFYIIIIFCSLLISFFSSLKFSKSNLVSYLFSILYTLSIAFLINYFHDGDLGITTSLIFLPMVIFGILDVLNKSNNYIKLSLGLSLMFLCQLPTAIIAGLFIVILVLINICNIRKSTCKTLLKSSLLIVLLTSIVWIPLLKIILFNRITTPTSPQIQNANALSIIKNVGIIPIFSIPVLFFCLRKLNILIKQIYWISILIIIGSSSYIPLIKILALFKPFHFINTFQFTARFLIIPQVVLCYLASWIIVKYLSKLDRYKIYFVGIIGLIILSQITGQMLIVHSEFNQNYKYADNYKSIRVTSMENNYIIRAPWMRYLRNGYMSNSDYYPLQSISEKEYINNDEAIYGHHQVIKIKHDGCNRFLFNNNKRISKLTLPFLYYNGENIRVNLNHHYITNGHNKEHLITINDVKKGNNIIKIEYIPNTLLILLRVSMILIGLIWILIVQRKILLKQK